MSLFLDQKYLNLISNRLLLFKRKSDHLYNCRCPICGDSSKKKSKARGYFYPNKARMMYKCHNCDASMYFSTFLKMFDGNLHSEYSLEEYTEGKTIKANTLPTLVFEEPKFKKNNSVLDGLMDKVSTLPEDHESVKFCIARKIPKIALSKIYFISNIKNIVQLNDKYKESIRTEEPRVVFPFYDENGALTAVTCRAIRGEALRYITVKIADDKPLIYGLEDVDKEKDVYVVEGPIDSLFLRNSIAIAGTSIGKINLASIAKEKFVVVFDNQPRNKEVCKIVESTIDSGYRVVIWPQNITEKDINEMVLGGRDVNKLVKENTYSGLQAKVKFTAWKRV